MAKGPGGAERIRIAKGIHIYRRPDSASWQADIVLRGRRARISLGTDDPTQARDLAIQEAARHQSEAGPVGGYSLNRALIDWMAYAPRSSREKSMVVRLRQLYPNRPASEVTEGTLMAALADLSPAYANRINNVARAALRLAARHEKILAAPIIGRRREPPGRQRFLSAEEWQRLREKLPDHLLPVVDFSLETGLRRGNLLRLRWSNVDLPRATAFVEAARAKSRQSIPVPLAPAAVAILKAQNGKHPEFVFTRRPTPVSHPDRYAPIGDPKKAWAAALKAAGIVDFRWHDQRHTWASWHTMNGTPQPVLRELGAWASLDMVQRYAHLEPAHLRQYAGKAGAGLAAATRKLRKPKVAA